MTLRKQIVILLFYFHKCLLSTRLHPQTFAKPQHYTLCFSEMHLHDAFNK